MGKYKAGPSGTPVLKDGWWDTSPDWDISDVPVQEDDDSIDRWLFRAMIVASILLIAVVVYAALV